MELDSVELLAKLCLTLLAPLIIGKLLRSHERVAGWVKDRKTELGLLSNGALITIVWIKISVSADKLYVIDARSDC